MPFSVKNFKHFVRRLVQGPAQEKLVQSADKYSNMAAPPIKAAAIHDLMALLDRETDIETRRRVMEACGRRCFSDSILKRAIRLRNQSTDVDDLLVRLNSAHIGGGQLHREGGVILAEYQKCYCGSVSQTRKKFSATYCHCSCGWYGKLFETALVKPVKVELLSSIIQGDNCCRFRISY